MASLENDWKLLYSKTLPSLAVSKSPTQEVWPVHLDHCFARIILDNIIGIDRPWTSRLASPALKNMTHEQLEKCIALGKAIADGREDLTELDAISLEMRGKKQKSAAYSKRRRATRSPMDTVERSPKRRQLSIKNALSITSPSTILSPTSTTLLDLKPPDNPGHDLTTLITTSNLSSFRQKVLLALCQVPRGRFTTYAAISNHLHSSARAVGNGLRNNPFAPRVPCHRVVVSHPGIDSASLIARPDS
ncbi:MAG: hypothetical protein LQ337_001450 [Flavoplaca oasis]|nr:MAG: hypothetical protein LQ337_001450 [Flavoplaca oasis]